MAFDGSVVYAITKELQKEINDGRIVKIVQPEKDELMLTIKKEGSQKRLLISVNPSLPMVYLTDSTKVAPLTAPTFCMLLRKHLINGHILNISQPSMERIIEIEIEHFNEMGDMCRKILTVELMGKYSNIILRDGMTILDSIRRVSSLMSSVREVLPGREYFVPLSKGKYDPFRISETEFLSAVFGISPDENTSGGSLTAARSLYTHITGFSPLLSEEVYYRSGLDSDRSISSFTEDEARRVYHAFQEVVSAIYDEESSPCIVFSGEEPVSFTSFSHKMYLDPRYTIKEYNSISALLYDYYSRKQSYQSLRQKTQDLRQIIHTLLNKDYKKYDLQLRQLRDTEKRDRYKVYGELLTAYGYGIEANSSSFVTTDFYTGKEITIPLDPTISAIENGKKYFARYAKLKRTADALNEIIVSTEDEIRHLESINISLDMAQNTSDIAMIRQELADSGYIRNGSAPSKNAQGKKVNKKSQGNSGSGKNTSAKSEPLHYVSSDGFHMYVGKNNFQNDNLTFKIATGNDWWFHAKDIPGSHVIVKCEGNELPDNTFEEAARLAAHYSKSADSPKVEVQYTQKKNIRKPPAAKPGFVVFHTYFSMVAETDISAISQIN